MFQIVYKIKGVDGHVSRFDGNQAQATEHCHVLLGISNCERVILYRMDGLGFLHMVTTWEGPAAA